MRWYQRTSPQHDPFGYKPEPIKSTDGRAEQDKKRELFIPLEYPTKGQKVKIALLEGEPESFISGSEFIIKELRTVGDMELAKVTGAKTKRSAYVQISRFNYDTRREIKVGYSGVLDKRINPLGFWPGRKYKVVSSDKAADEVVLKDEQTGRTKVYSAKNIDQKSFRV